MAKVQSQRGNDLAKAWTTLSEAEAREAKVEKVLGKTEARVTENKARA